MTERTTVIGTQAAAAQCISEKTMPRMDELLKIVGRPRHDFSKIREYGREGWGTK